MNNNSKNRNEEVKKGCTSGIFYIFFSEKNLTQHPRKLTRKNERYNWGKVLTLKAIGLCHNLDISISD